MKIQSLFLTFLVILLVFLTLLGFRSGTIPRVFSSLSPMKNSLEHSETSKRDDSVDKTLKACFDELEITEPNIKRQFYPEDSTVRYEIAVPRGKPIELIIWQLTSTLKKFSYHTKDCVFNSRKNTCTAIFTTDSRTKPYIEFKITRSSAFFSKTAKIAVIIEDFGFEANKTTVEFLSFPHPLTVSLVSNGKLSGWTAQIANEYKKEIIILLGLEPLPQSVPNNNKSTIMVHYPEDQIISMFDKTVELIPNFAGFSNLGGDRVMADSRVMKIIFSQVNKNHGYFIINSTTRKSVAEDLASQMEIPYEIIDMTIDTEKDSDVILESIRRCILSAHKTGKILINGKATESFINALNEAVPVFKHNGIELVYVSDIIRHPDEY